MPYFTKYFCKFKLDEENTLLLNTLTSALDIVDNDTLKEINKMIESKDEISKQIGSPLYNKLKQRGYICESENKEKAILNKFEKNIKDVSLIYQQLSPFDFTICPTMGCNLRCTYCFEEEKYHKNLEVMSDKKLDVIFDYIKQRNKLFKKLKLKKGNFLPKNLNIKLFGGEPLLKSNYLIVKKIYEFGYQNQLPIQLITNGTSIDDKYFELLKKYNWMSRVQITLDGDKATHDKRRIHADGSGSFDQTCDGIQKVLDSGVRLDLRINVDKDNIYKLKELEELFNRRKWSQNPLFLPYASPVQSFNSNKLNNLIVFYEMLDILVKKGWYGKKDSFIKEVLSPAAFTVKFFNSSSKEVKPWKKTYCEATAGSSYCFSPDGTITNCLTYAGCKERAIGHFDESGVTIDKEKLLKWINRSPFNMEKCKDCKFILFCGGGCPAKSIEKGDINCPVCGEYEKSIEAYVVKCVKDKLLAEKN